MNKGNKKMRLQQRKKIVNIPCQLENDSTLFYSSRLSVFT